MPKKPVVVAPLDDSIDPWEQQPQESGRAWAAFMRYRDTPAASRNLSALARALSVAKQSVTEMARRHRWQARVRAYDQHLDAIRLAETRDEIERVARQNVILALMTQGKVMNRLKNLDARTIGIKSLPAFLKALSSLEQAARGTHVRLTGATGGPVDVRVDDSRQRLADLLGGALLGVTPSQPDDDDDGKA